jgi:hypothetical protein
LVAGSSPARPTINIWACINAGLLLPSSGGSVVNDDELEALLEREKKRGFREVAFYAAIVIAILVFSLIQHFM